MQKYSGENKNSEQTKTNIWLGTSPKTRAETYYRKAGWTEIGSHGKDEIKFEMTYKNWEKCDSQYNPPARQIVLADCWVCDYL